jgi:hypothetical protein
MHAIKTVLVFCLSLLILQPASAQIICTDVNPDIMSSGNATLDIDLNNDATPDFRITSAQSGTTGFVLVQGSQIGTGNFVLTDSQGATAIPLSTPIGSNSTTWSQMNSTNVIMAIALNTTVTGNWAGAIDQYLGLKLVVGSNIFYGWARFSFSSSSNAYTFKEYAYNSVPDQQVVAGQGCGSLAFPVFALSNTLCVGSTATLVASTGTAVPTQIGWASTPAGGIFSSPTASMTTVSFSASGVYTVLLAVLSGTNFGLGQSTVSVGITPTISSNSPICSGQSLVFTAPAGGVSYSWGGPSGFSSAVQNASIMNASPAQSGTYSLSLVSAAGCSATVSTTVVVNPAPSVTITPNTSTICALNGSVSLVAGGAASYNWFPFQSLAGSGTNVTATPSVTTIYTCIATAVNGCTAGSTATVNVVAPAGQWSIGLGSGTMCAQGFNNSVNSITLSLTGNNSYTLSSLNPPGVSSTNLANLTTVFTPLPPFQPAQVVVTPTLVTSDGICSILIPVSFSIVPNPVIQPATGALNVCPGQPAIFTVSGADTYSWSSLAAGLNSYTNATVTATSSVTTVFPVFGQSQGCNSATESVTLTVLPVPVVTVNDATVCLNQHAVLTASGATGYAWAGPGGFTASGATISIAAMAGTGLTVYMVTGTGTNSCTTTRSASVTVVNCVGLMEEHLTDLPVYPNPVHDLLYIPSGENILSVQVVDILGKTVLIKNGATQTVDVSALPAGIYFVKMAWAGREVRSARVVKE